jgi:hypothetical protein
MTRKEAQVMNVEGAKVRRMPPLKTPTDLTANATKDISGALTILRDPSRYSQQDLAPRMKRAVVEHQYLGRNPAPNLRHKIAKWLIVAALFTLAALVTMAPFMSL